MEERKEREKGKEGWPRAAGGWRCIDHARDARKKDGMTVGSAQPRGKSGEGREERKEKERKGERRDK